MNEFSTKSILDHAFLLFKLYICSQQSTVTGQSTAVAALEAPGWSTWPQRSSWARTSPSTRGCVSLFVYLLYMYVYIYIKILMFR